MESKYKVLIVEDDELTRQIYFERLSLDEDIEVEAAIDGLDGLNKIKTNDYDLVLSGIQMPNKTGFELYEEMKLDPKYSRIPFMILSHLGRVEDMQKAKDIGISYFIVRGTTTPDEVNTQIKDILNQNRYNISKDNITHKILVIEDDKDIREVFTDRFNQHPNIIAENAIDGLDGFNKIQANNYDLIFSGIQMPNKTGFDLYKDVKDLKDKNKIPIVLFSHLGRTEDIETAKSMGVKYFIIRGQNTPNDILNQILSILSAQDKQYSLNISKESKDYNKFIESILGQDCTKYEDENGLPIRVVLSNDSKPYRFFIELDCEIDK